jgi:hypothetical protein
VHPQKPTNVVSAAVEITLDGRTLELRFRTYAFREYRRRLKRDLIGDIADLIPKCEMFTSTRLGDFAGRGESGATDTGIDEVLGRLCEIVWVAALDAQPDVKLEEIERLIGLQNIQTVTTKLITALVPGLPEPQPGAASNGSTNPTEASSMSDGSLTIGASSGLAVESTTPSSRN